MSKSTTIQPAPQFAAGELVVITGTGMSWDGQIAAVMSIERVNPLDENDYIVFVERQDEDGRGRGCYLPASQLRPAPQPKSAQPKSTPTDPQEKPSKSAPRFECGQRVRIIANQGGLYAAQIGVIGVIERKRQYRRWGYHTYDVGYQDEKGRDKRLTSVREDDLEPVADVADAAAPEQLGDTQATICVDCKTTDVSRLGYPVQMHDHRCHTCGSPICGCHAAHWDTNECVDCHKQTKKAQTAAQPATAPEQPPAPFRLGQRVTVRPPADGAEDEYPSFTHYPIVGEIASTSQVTASGVRCYDVRFPRIVGGVSTDCWPPVSIREEHLVPEPSRVGWMAHEAAMEQVKSRVKASTTASTTASTKMPDKPPLFSVGEHVTVDSHSALAYETFTRKGAVGVITEIGKPVRGIRRYIVRFEVAHLAGTRETRIREEHLLKAEPPAPREYATARHAYQYRDRHPQGEHLWCDAAGCFEEACAICQQHPVPTLFQAQPTMQASSITASELPYSTAALAALGADDTYEFAVTLVREKLEHDEGRDAILAWQTARQLIALPGGSTCYDVTRGGFYVTLLRGQKCSIRYALKTLVAEAERRIAGVPRQVGLWGSAVRA